MTDAPSPAVRVHGLSRSFGTRKALRGADFALPQGASLAVFGPNGAGKTTLLRLLALLDRPSAGSIELFGCPVADDADALRARIGLISHNPMLYLDLSAEENLVLFARLYGVPEPQRRARELLELVELSHRRTDAVRGFSRGMLQRVSIARALVHGPELVLLDEPYTGLDPHASAIVAGLVEAGEARTLVTVSHDLERGWRAATHVLLLARGRQELFVPVDALPFDELKSRYSRLVEGRAA